MFQNSVYNRTSKFFFSLVLTASILSSLLPLSLVHAEEPTEEPIVEETIIEEEPTEAPADSAADTTPEDTDEHIEASTAEDDVAAEPTDSPSENDGEEGTIVGDTHIETGNAEAGTSATTEVNFTELTTSEGASSTDETTDTDTASSTDESPLASLFPDPADELTVSSTNTATTTTTATTTAATGDNTASGGQNVTIDTGDAVAYADVLNVVNTNIVNSDGLVQFINEVLGYSSFDLRDDFSSIFGNLTNAQSTALCTLVECQNSGVNAHITNSNTADITNNIDVLASTGSNTASGTNAYIETGDAYASANVVNVANTNIVDSNYLLLVFNNFDDYAGNIILPNSDVFTSLFGLGQGRSAATVESRNYADVANNVNVAAHTGNNTATGNNTYIETGDASALGNAQNIVNGNYFNTSSFSLLIRVHGEWTGKINGLPDGMTWVETPEGIRIMSESAAGIGSTGANITNNNTANITNNVNVFALSGDNKATGENAGIVTGDAHADASILNLANTNIVGSNWASLIFNIYGNWDGNLSFGNHDLWLGVTASSEDNPIMPNSLVDYTFTVFNKGDTDANDVVVTGRSKPTTLSFATVDSGSGSEVSWQLGSIPAGETREFTRRATVSGYLDNSKVTALPLEATVSSDWEDDNPEDNTDTVTVYAGRKDEPNNSLGRRFPAGLEIEKIANRTYASAGDTVDYIITVKNHGGQLYDAGLVDIMEDVEGNVVSEQTWPLDTIYNGDTIVIEYSIELPPDMSDTVLTNTAQVFGFHGSDRKRYQFGYESPVATHELTVGNGQVLGMSTSACPRYLSTYMSLDTTNDMYEVRKLQTFLNSHSNAGLVITDVFDYATEVAVRDFQEKYRADILDPWGMTTTSGYVYYTTQKKINEIFCGYAVDFPLSETQLTEINDYKRAGDTSEMLFGDATPAAKEEEVITSAANTEPEPQPEDSSLSQSQAPAAARTDEEEETDEEDAVDPNVISRIYNFIFGLLPRATAGR